MEYIREKVIVFGTGSAAEKALSYYDEKYIEIVAVVDNAVSKHGEKFINSTITSPEKILQYTFDKIVVCSVYYESIKKQLIEKLGIEETYIVNKFYFLKTQILLGRIEVKPKNEEIDVIKKYWKTNDFGVFNGKFVKKYADIQPLIFKDEKKDLYYVIHNDRKMYFSRKLNTYEKIYEYYRFLLMEQDEQSPHRYLTPEMESMKDKVVIDAGVAEGNFGMEIIDEVKKLIMIEADPDWIEALQYTFEPFKEKVVFYQNYLCDISEENKICIDDIGEAKEVDFIKLDIEGAEISALKGAEKIIVENERLKILVCCYHKKEDEEQIREILEKRKFKISVTKGYMMYMDENWGERMKTVEMTKGVLYARQ